jgi:acyl-CoA synthetase (AMP-forming)/AMP-acid ligase II
VEVLRAADSEAAQRRAAGALLARGLRRGDRVAFTVASSGQLLSALLGALRVGVVPVVLNPALLAHERRALLEDARPQLVIDGPGPLAALDDGAPVDLAPLPLARPMHYTSGTTGVPKGVWSGVLAEHDAAALAGEEAELWGFAPDDRHLVCSPLHHSAPIRFAAGTLLAGGEVLILPRFEAELAAEAIARWRPTTTFMVPAHLHRLFALPTGPDLGSFRLLAHAGAPCPTALKRRAMAAFPLGSVWEFYGSTEGQFTACPPAEWEARPGTVGRARPGRRLHVDHDGTIWCDAPAHARFGYWGDAERTNAAWRGTSFTVGDVGRLDDDGYLWLDGRRDDLIITGGVNVYPAEIEQVLAEVVGVEEVAVFGAADERWGQRVCAAVVGDADPAALAEHLRARLAPYKRPKDLYRVEALPRTSTGKLARRRLPSVLGLDPPPDGAQSVGRSGAS